MEGTLRVGTLTGYPASVATRSHCRLSVVFPLENTPRLSSAIQASEEFDFQYESVFSIDSSNQTVLDSLIAEPLKITLLSVSADTRHQTPAFEFQLYMDSLLIHRKTVIEADLIGKHIEEGEFDASVTAPTLHLSFEVNEPLIDQETAHGSAILRLKVEDLHSLPNAIISSTLHPDEKIHPFDYFVAFRLPCGRVIQLNSGSFIFEDPPIIKWEGIIRVFLPASSVNAILEENSEVLVEVWRDLNEDFAHFPLPDSISALVNGRGNFASSEFTKPGQSHYVSEIPLRKKNPEEEPIRAPDPAQIAEEPDPKRGRGGARKISSRSNARKKQKRPVTAKDKKQIKVLQTAWQELTDTDGFNDQTQLSIDFQFSHALVLKPLVPHPTIKPSQLCHKQTELRAHRLEEATREFREAVQKLAQEIVTAQKERQDCQLAVPDFPDDLHPLLNKMPSYHIALEKLSIAISYTFSEFSVAHEAQSETQLQTLLNILPMYLHDELGKQMPDIFIPSRKPIDKRTFLITESEEAELMGRQNAATELLEELLAMDLTDAESWWLYSCLMMKHGDLARAEECVRRGLTCDPNHLKLSILFASLLTRQEKYIDAIDFLNAAHFEERIVDVVLSILKGLANLPSKPAIEEGESSLDFANELMELMDVVFAEQLIAQEQMAKGETAEVLYMFGRLHYYLHDFPKAVSFLGRAVALDATADALLLLGHVEFERSRYEEAAHWFDQGLEMRFEQGAALRQGFIYLKMGEFLKAESILFQCSPQSASVLLGLTIAAMNMEKFKQADELLNYATVINNRHPDIWAYLAIFSNKMNRPEEAKHAAQMAKKWNLTDPDLIQQLKDLKIYDIEEQNSAQPEENQQGEGNQDEYQVDEEDNNDD